MIKENLRDLLIEEAREVIKSQLKEDLIIDKLYNEGELKFSLEEVPSKLGLDFSYDLIVIEPMNTVQNDSHYSLLNIKWQLPYRIVNNKNIPHTNLSFLTINGIIPFIEFQVKYDESTGDPRISISRIKYEYNATVTRF